MAQFHGGGHGSGPRAEILRSKIPTGGLAEVVIHGAGIDGVFLAGVIHVLEQLLTGKFLARANNLSDAAVFNFDDVLLAAFAAEFKFDPRAAHLDVTVFHRGQTVRFVLAGVFFVANTDEADSEQANHRRQYFFTAQAGEGEVAFEAAADAGQGVDEIDDALEFGLVANLAPARVIEVLLALPVVASGGLEVAVVQGANPYVLPRGRNHERRDAFERVAIAQDVTCGGAILKAAGMPFAADAGMVIADVTEADGLRGLGGRFFGFSVCVNAVKIRGVLRAST